MEKHLHRKLPNTHFNKYAKPTVDFVLELLAEAFEDQTKMDRFLNKLSEEVFEELIKSLKELERKKKFDWDQKIELYNHPELLRVLKEIEWKQMSKFVDYCWYASKIIEDSMMRSYKKTILQTYVIYDRPAPNLNAKVQTKDTYIRERVLNIPWCQDGKTYSERLYGHVSQFQKKLAFVLEEGIQKGKGMDWMMKSWRKLTGSTMYDTARLLKTETMAMWSLATKDSLLDMGVEYVEIVGDAMCGGVCLDYVGEAVPLNEAVIGDLLPPYHPNCACSFVEYTEMIN